MHQATTRPPSPGATGPCGHLACADKPACIYLPGTYTPAAHVRVDYCAPGCWHCKGGAS